MLVTDDLADEWFGSYPNVKYPSVFRILVYDAVDFLKIFDHSSYSKNLCYYNLFYCDLIYHEIFFKYDINNFIFAQKFLNKTNGQTLVKKLTASYIKI